MKLTEEEREEMAAMTTDELRVVVESAVRKRKAVKDDKGAYTKACNDIIKLQEARMNHAVDVLASREPKVPAAPPPAPGLRPPPPPPSH
jgi:hypothetical protein